MEAFEMLGLNADKLMHTFAAGGPQAKQAFTQIMQMIGDVEDPVARNTIGVALMGSQFEDLEVKTITAMGSARTQFDMTIDKMSELNQIKFNSPGEAAARIGRQLKTNLIIPIGDKLLPYLTQFSVWMENAGPQIQKVGGALIDGIAKGINAVVDGVKYLVDNIDVIGPALGGFATVILIALVPAMWAWVTAQYASAAAGWAAIAPWLPVIGLALLVAAAITGVILVFKNWGAISTWLVNVWNNFKTWVMNIFNSIIQFFKTWGTTILVVLGGPIVWAVALVVKYWKQIKTFTISIFTSIGNWLSSTWNQITSSVSNSVTNIWTKIKEIWDRIIGFLKGINLFDIGKNIIEGLVNGIGSMANAVVDRVKDIGNSITDKVKGILGIHSPSRVMMEMGVYTGEGLALGIDSTQNRVGEASASLANEVKGQPAYVKTTAPAPARVVSSSASSSSRIDLSIAVKVDGSGSNEKMGSDIALQVKQQVQEILESTIRRMGLTPEVVE
ncbi:hypothetical protein BVG16_13780 [Paenibacillus selenitireducens]|uniref:Phage tail tape measure protein n=1 Tax=Paenibacillus selenitireducens TaxID=1324314 RepID=A0A1T2XC79_9BACL|nr:hypothetical protein [Paenibacillus selenitireducens]OPA77517.1 hypothetical protein BVG16_13780 [Paenibacillus selenitireducens]